MAITVVGSDRAHAAANGLTLPTGWQEGDFALIMGGQEYNNSPRSIGMVSSGSMGYTKLDQEGPHAGNSKIFMDTWYKVLTASESDPDFYSGMCTWLLVLRGVDPDTPFDVARARTDVTNDADTEMSAPSIATITDGCLIIRTHWEGGLTGSVYLNGHSSHSEGTVQQNFGTNAGSDGNMSVTTSLQTTRGATGTATAVGDGGSSGNSDSMSWTIALRPHDQAHIADELSHTFATSVSLAKSASLTTGISAASAHASQADLLGAVTASTSNQTTHASQADLQAAIAAASAHAMTTVSEFAQLVIEAAATFSTSLGASSDGFRALEVALVQAAQPGLTAAVQSVLETNVTAGVSATHTAAASAQLLGTAAIAQSAGYAVRSVAGYQAALDDATTVDVSETALTSLQATFDPATALAAAVSSGRDFEAAFDPATALATVLASGRDFQAALDSAAALSEAISSDRRLQASVAETASLTSTAVTSLIFEVATSVDVVGQLVNAAQSSLTAALDQGATAGHVVTASADLNDGITISASVQAGLTGLVLIDVDAPGERTVTVSLESRDIDIPIEARTSTPSADDRSSTFEETRSTTFDSDGRKITIRHTPK